MALAAMAAMAVAPDNGFPKTLILQAQVNTKGRAESCVVTNPSGDDALDRSLCATLVKRMRWKPARDDAGHPVASTVRVPVPVTEHKPVEKPE